MRRVLATALLTCSLVASPETLAAPASPAPAIRRVLTPPATRLRLSSKPPGATITLDGKPRLEVTPTTLEVTPGEHEVWLDHVGYRPAGTTVEAVAGLESPLLLELEPHGRLSAGDVELEPRSELAWVYVPGSEVSLGRASDPDCPSCEPGRRERVAPLWIMKTEVTVEAFATCVEAGACDAGVRSRDFADQSCNWKHGRKKHPINCVVPEEAVQFCRWVGGRLPTSTEWELAAKSGRIPRYPWGEDLPDATHANFCDRRCREGLRRRGTLEPTASPARDDTLDDGFQFTSPVASYPHGATLWHLYDMAGNVAELTSTRSGTDQILIRGGSFGLESEELRTTRVDLTRLGYFRDSVGFRCARSERPNPVLEPWKTPLETPPFERITMNDVAVALDDVGWRAQLTLAAVGALDVDALSFANTMGAIEAVEEQARRASDVYFTLERASETVSVEAAYDDVELHLADQRGALAHHRTLFSRLEAIPPAALDDAQSYHLERLEALLIAHGASLGDADAHARDELEDAIAERGESFQSHYRRDQDQLALVVSDPADLEGLPPEAVTAAADAASSRGLVDRWVFEVKGRRWEPFLTYSSRRALREQLYGAFLSAGNLDDFSANSFLAAILKLRSQRALRLGFASEAHQILAGNVLSDPGDARAFLDSLSGPVFEQARREAVELSALAGRDGIAQLQPWDWWYYEEKLRRERAGLDEARVRPYFELDRVRRAALDLAGELFGLSFVERKDIAVYDADVRVFEARNANGTSQGLLYLDLVARKDKRGPTGSRIVRQSHGQGDKKLPTLTQVLASVRPTSGADGKILLDLDEVADVFAAIGDGVGDLLATGSFPVRPQPESTRVASRLFAHWAFEPELLTRYARHATSGEALPADLVDAIRRSRRFGHVHELAEQLASQYLELAWVTLDHPSNLDVVELEEQTLDAIHLPWPIRPYFPSTSFGAARRLDELSWLSDWWADVAAADLFAAFRAGSLLDHTQGAALRNYLERVTLEDGLASFRSFRGRDPSPRAFLESVGVAAELLPP
jgi:peptidyl-dipeptidase Dcp